MFKYQNPVLNGQPSSKKENYFVAFSFLIVGLILSLIIPYLISPKTTDTSIQVPAKIVAFYSNQETYLDKTSSNTSAPVFEYITKEGELLNQHSNISSSSTSYELNQKIEVYYDQLNPQNAWIKDDQDLNMMMSILQWFGLYFIIFAPIIFFMHWRGIEDYLVERYSGIIGALSFGIPSILALPMLYWSYLNRPNFFFDKSLTEFPSKILLIGTIFSILGVIVTAATYFLVKALGKSKVNSIHFTKQL